MGRALSRIPERNEGIPRNLIEELIRLEKNQPTRRFGNLMVVLRKHNRRHAGYHLQQLIAKSREGVERND